MQDGRYAERGRTDIRAFIKGNGGICYDSVKSSHISGIKIVKMQQAGTVAQYGFVGFNGK